MSDFVVIEFRTIDCDWNLSVIDDNRYNRPVNYLYLKRLYQEFSTYGTRTKMAGEVPENGRGALSASTKSCLLSQTA